MNDPSNNQTSMNNPEEEWSVPLIHKILLLLVFPNYAFMILFIPPYLYFETTIFDLSLYTDPASKEDFLMALLLLVTVFPTTVIMLLYPVYSVIFKRREWNEQFRNFFYSVKEDFYPERDFDDVKGKVSFLVLLFLVFMNVIFPMTMTIFYISSVVKFLSDFPIFLLFAS